MICHLEVLHQELQLYEAEHHRQSQCRIEESLAQLCNKQGIVDISTIKNKTDSIPEK